MPKLSLYNTKGRRLQEFEPAQPPRVGMYCCGPTVYHYAHIGNLRTYVNEDFLRRTLEYLGWEVVHVVNITDVGHLTSDSDEGDDKMEKGAAREGRTVWEIADHYTQAFFADWHKLNLREPSHWPRATGYIAEQIELVKSLEEKGYTYRTSDGIYFDTSRFPRYGEFAGIDLDKLQAGARVEMGDKRAPTDFALWKFSPTDKQRAMEWESPWGKGFPGWHIECSAMSMALVGKTLDIHCGGTDHIRVHHTNEIAQSECANDVEFARFWIHNEFLRVDGDKMSKSSGEFLTVSLLEEKGFHALDYRYFCTTAHYRSFLTFSWEGMQAAREAHRSFRRRAAALRDAWRGSRAAELDGPREVGEAEKEWQGQFLEAIGQDLNIPKALGIAHSMARDGRLSEAERGRLLLDWDRVLGLDLETDIPEPEVAVDETLAREVEGLLVERQAARQAKDWGRADAIRTRLTELGVEVMDTPTGPTWRKKD